MQDIFKDSLPSWTNKEVLLAFGSAAAVVISALTPALIALHRALSAGLRHRMAMASDEVRDLKQKLESAKKERLDTSPDDLIASLEAARDEARRLAEEKLAAVSDSTRHAELAESHRDTSAKLQEHLQEIQSQFTSERRRITRALEKTGFTWTERVRYNAPDFRPLEERRMPIVSILNLKGGVGKTTLTANLGAALSRRGWKVLLIDLDLQGSLTSLFLPEQDQASLEEKRLFIGDFLARSFDAEYPNLLNYTQPVLGTEDSAIVGTVDTLVYAETNLTVRWLLREGHRDPRFILRRELHLKRISNTFDIVLLDCPPLINICCVNALAASDSVLIPVMPSKATTDRVPVLLSRMLQFRENINGQLKVLGMVANRTFGAELTSDEKNRLSELEIKAKNVWGEAVPRLDSFIRQSTEVRSAEDEHRPLTESDKMSDAFDLLANEIEGRLPTFCRATGTRAIAPAEVNS
ncbi:AAA family ATPase [Singulisphaera rosea]